MNGRRVIAFQGLSFRSGRSISNSWPSSRRPSGARCVIDLCAVDAELVHEQVDERRRCTGGDLEPDDVAEAPAQQLCLDGLEQIVGVAGDGEVGIARDAEHGVADLVARDHCREEVQDRVLDRNAGAVAADLDEPRQVVGHVDADEPRCGLGAVGGDDADVQRQRGQQRERGGRADRDRCQERLDLAPEALRQRSQLAARALVHRDDADAFRREGRPQLVEPQRFLRCLQGARLRTRRPPASEQASVRRATAV